MLERLKSLLQPLNLAGLLTWTAVLLSLRAEEGGFTALRVGLMVVFLTGFLLLDLPGLRRRTQELCVWVEMAAAFGVIAVAPRTGTSAVLLVILAAQVGMLWPPRRALLMMLAANAVFVGLVLRAHHPAPWLFITIYLGFQSFAALIGHYARTAERTRDQLALVNADLLATRALLADSARDAERLRVARELHDVAGHKLTAMKLNLRALAADPTLAAYPQVATSEQLASELLQDIRNVVQALRDTRGLDLQTALRALAAPLPNLRLSLQLDEAITVRDPAMAETLLRVVQEALTNAARHAQATVLSVELSQGASGLELHIHDDGQAPAVLVEGNGLAGMRERIEQQGGRLTIERSRAGGLALHARFAYE
ncbi:MAG TPA: histidine kinase [Pseudoxanthomonas sp.]|nr:histidine kinase [Pseudoxanthomonas sp.]